MALSEVAVELLDMWHQEFCPPDRELATATRWTSFPLVSLCTLCCPATNRSMECLRRIFSQLLYEVLTQGVIDRVESTSLAYFLGDV
jgi:hypothetical protein